jgi:hypothetical protein
MLRYYFGDKFLVISINEMVTQYRMGDLSPVELSYLSKIVDVIADEHIKGSIK